MNVIRSRQHCLTTEQVNKIALSANDDKRIIRSDKIQILAHGYRTGWQCNRDSGEGSRLGHEGNWLRAGQDMRESDLGQMWRVGTWGKWLGANGASWDMKWSDWGQMGLTETWGKWLGANGASWDMKWSDWGQMGLGWDMRGTGWGQRKMGHNAQNLSTHVVLYCVKRSMSVSVALLPHVWKPTVSIRLWEWPIWVNSLIKLCLCRLLFTQYSKCIVFKQELATLLGLFGPPAVIRRPELCPPFPPSLRPCWEQSYVCCGEFS